MFNFEWFWSNPFTNNCLCFFFTTQHPKNGNVKSLHQVQNSFWYFCVCWWSILIAVDCCFEWAIFIRCRNVVISLNVINWNEITVLFENVFKPICLNKSNAQSNVRLNLTFLVWKCENIEKKKTTLVYSFA